ncbi:hypothetical protein PGT21_016889 [Puccinia graminis f. sp. tritici]|uniref:Uncharacterized protein n=1 Tax=Puccinia graminis f. sp. tritici TaxID=56615 RepID=A0A5B0NW58_PUCGR|nr:hypothetical protein PGT21_016889 [Puccinia graminis f. sp. tritici]KAA1093471.1 hypothetical protein PGTUg99_020319 [Puccinia graminis f. sp. tritici]
MKLPIIAYTAVLTLVVLAVSDVSGQVTCELCKQLTVDPYISYRLKPQAACGEPLVGGLTCQIQRPKLYYKCKRSECRAITSINAVPNKRDSATIRRLPVENRPCSHENKMVYRDPKVKRKPVVQSTQNPVVFHDFLGLGDNNPN